MQLTHCGQTIDLSQVICRKNGLSTCGLYATNPYQLIWYSVMPGKNAELPIRRELLGFRFRVKVQFRIPFQGFVEVGDRLPLTHSPTTIKKITAPNRHVATVFHSTQPTVSF